MAGSWGRFGGLGAQLADLARVQEVALKRNQEGAAKLAQERNHEWRQPARGRRNIKQIGPRLEQPTPSPVARGFELWKEFEARLGKETEDFLQ